VTPRNVFICDISPEIAEKNMKLFMKSAETAKLGDNAKIYPVAFD
jgi:hypothetical protein